MLEQDNVQEVDDPNLWIKSNPLLDVDIGYDVMSDYLTTKLSVARLDGSLKLKLVQNSNIWRQATEDSYLDSELWKELELSEKPDIAGKRAWIGIDVGRTSDLLLFTWLIPQEGWWWLDGQLFVALKGGIDNKMQTDRIDYLALEQHSEGEMCSLECGMFDNDRVYEWLEDSIERNDLDV